MKETALAVLLLVHYGIVEAKVLDIHIEHPGESYEIERGKIEQENARNWEIFRDDSSSSEEKNEAVDSLIKNGGMS